MITERLIQLLNQVQHWCILGKEPVIDSHKYIDINTEWGEVITT